MKPIRHGTLVLLAILSLTVTTLVFPSVAQASSSYDSLLRTTPSLIVYTNGATKSQTMDVSQFWLNSLGQTYAKRVAQNIGWPTNFMTELNDIAAFGGSLGVMLHETSDGNTLEIVGSRDPNASCGFVGDTTTGSYQCTSNPGYGFVHATYFTHNSYGSNGCIGSGMYLCSDDGMNIYAAPTVQTGTAGYTMLSISDAVLSQYKFYYMRFTLAYPTGYAGAMIPTSPPPAKYVAMGDSFSSGEGNAPFEPGTDQDGDRCHRSPMAYPRKVESTLNLGATAFVACSGATIHDILNNNPNNVERAQALYISGQTDIMTMSIGGNNVNFAPSMQTCTVRNTPTADQTAAGLTQEQVDQADCAQALSTSASLINSTLGTSLTNLYKDVESLAPNAKLLIVGYPQLFPDYSSISGSCTWGSALVPPFNGAGTPSGRAVSSTEVSTIRSLTDQMNSLIQTAVNGTNSSNIAYVPTTVFAGHELCTNDPWLNGVMLNVDKVYIAGSYHPNAAGQTAYASAVTAAISSLVP